MCWSEKPEMLDRYQPTPIILPFLEDYPRPQSRLHDSEMPPASVAGESKRFSKKS